ncbi:BglG family transcription antiterminator [Bacillus smithii]|uniref:BglG family transcription antiterminator n=1 Tax=Bacillus smithii TaxID=1479 RepID=UPI003D1BD392
MTLDYRSMAVLTKLVRSPSFVTVQELTESLNVSKRTVYYDMKKINYWLEKQKLPSVQYVRSQGFYLEEKSKREIPKKMPFVYRHYEYSPKERKAKMMVLLLMKERPIFLADLLKMVDVSRNTVIEDIKGLKEECKKFHVQIVSTKKKGYILFGKELDLRNALVYFLSQLSGNKEWMNGFFPVLQEVKTEHLNLIYKMISESESMLNLHFTDEDVQTLSLRVYLFSKRIKQGHFVEMDSVEKDILRSTKEYLAAQHIGKQLERCFKLEIPEDEIYFLTTHLLSSKVIHSQNLDARNSDVAALQEVCQKMVDDFQKYSCVFFRNRKAVENHLLLHLKPAFYRLKYGIKVNNPLFDSIKTNYADIFALTKKVINHFQKLVGKPIPDDETALLAVHFGGWLNREEAEGHQRKKAVIVCANGVGTSLIMHRQLKELLPNVEIVDSLTKRQYDSANLDVDFVVSTVPLQDRGIPVFLTNPIMNEAEKNKLLKWTNHFTNDRENLSVQAFMNMIEKYADIHDYEGLARKVKELLSVPSPTMKEVYKPMLNELIDEDHIVLKEEENSWEDAIKTASEPLLKTDAVTEGYVDAMIESVHELGPYIVIAPKVAIPHARPEKGVNRLGMTLLRLKKGVPFAEDGSRNVHLVIVLAAVDNETHLKALSQLSNLLSDSQNIEQLIKADTKKEILDLINQYSKE